LCVEFRCPWLAVVSLRCVVFSEQATVRGRCRRCERQRLVSQRNEVQVLANWSTVTKNKKSAQAQNDEFE
ncbi:hypothetical protein, partial [Pseudomonas veronii]|uniref:hypothetical protein n=1 Tax=Pseudomonas veronii TaxID=76761 RepID=UPI001C430D29